MMIDSTWKNVDFLVRLCW